MRRRIMSAVKDQNLKQIATEVQTMQSSPYKKNQLKGDRASSHTPIQKVRNKRMASSFYGSVLSKPLLQQGRNDSQLNTGPVAAELINEKLLSRIDMIKLYAPPLKAHQLPENNPFYTKNFKEDTLDETANGQACFNIIKAKFNDQFSGSTRVDSAAFS